MNFIEQNWREIGEYVALAGGWAVVISRLAHVYEEIVNHGGLIGIFKALLFGSAKRVKLHGNQPTCECKPSSDS